MAIDTVRVTDIGPTFKFKVPEYGIRFPSTVPILGIYLGTGSRVQVQVPEYREFGPISVTHTVYGLTEKGQDAICLKSFFERQSLLPRMR